MRFYWVNSIMSAFTLLEVIAGATFLVAAAVSVLLWIRNPAGCARLTLFDQLLDRVHARRAVIDGGRKSPSGERGLDPTVGRTQSSAHHQPEIFARHRSPPGTIQAREELLAE